VVLFSALATALDVRSVLNHATEQAKLTVAQLEKGKILGKMYPSNSAKPEHDFTSWEVTKPGAWTSGFFPGTLWQLFGFSGKKDFALQKAAVTMTEGLRSQQYDKSTHDVGFKIFCSFGSGLNYTNGTGDYESVLRTAASSLSTRYSPIVGCIRSWNGPNFQVIIDNMMNLELLWWVATHLTSDPQAKHYFEIAVNHSDHMIRDCIKPDASSYHLIVYNETDGNLIARTNTPQGYPGGVWARGEAWALYGFVKAYSYSGYQRYLDEAIKIANYFQANLPADFIPYWDFRHPASLSERDTSAAAVAASAYLQLAKILSNSNHPDSSRYHQLAISILTSLSNPPYLGESKLTDALLLQGCVGYNTAMDVSLIYADYYFVEALLMLL